MQDFVTPPKHVNFPHSCWNNTDSVTKMIGITVI